MIQQRICAVVIASDKSEQLAECVRAIAVQTRPVDAIFVVTNSDGTAASIESAFSSVTLVQVDTGAGRTERICSGLQTAHSHGFEWFWTVDEHLMAVPDALQMMTAYAGIADFIYPSILVDNKVRPWEGTWNLALPDRVHFVEDLSFRHGREWISADYATFEGALLRRTVIDNIGLPDPAFFDGGEEIYGYLCSLHSNVIYLNRVGFVQNHKPATTASRQVYLRYRNRFLTYAQLQRAGVPLSRPAFWIFNILSIPSTLAVEGIASIRGLRAVISGISDGLHARFGRPVSL